jgi:2-polyprenyl-3-methyl-5-hydroxy-6-metoxy-1,4-benzoquinol methylase
MPGTPVTGAHSELDRLRHEYESSTSWKVTRPLRAARSLLWRFGREPPGAGAADGASALPPPGHGRYDAWLTQYFGEQLEAIEAACRGSDARGYALFRALSDDVWALLLTKEYDLYPNIRALLPDLPEASIQERWNGASGVTLAAQGQEFYSKLRDRFAEHGTVPMQQAQVLDFGCGWGRLTRLLARDVAPGRLYGCDPVQAIVDVCHATRVPARIERTEFVPEQLPFDQKFDLAFAFSVFTHLSERAHEACLSALHRSLRPGGVLILTVRPPEYLSSCWLMASALEALGSDPSARMSEPLYLFVPHEADAEHPQYAAGEMTYGETVITLAYVRERWSTLFDLLAVDLLIGDLQQVVLTLRRRG